MPRNYSDQNKIERDFGYLDSVSQNKALYDHVVTASSDGVAKRAKITLPPSYRLLREDCEDDSFCIVLVSDTTSEVVYYIKCVLVPDVHLNAKPVTQVLLWRTSVVAHRKVTSGMAEDIFRNYLLESYSIIASDSCQTREGRDFWVRQLGYAIEYGEHVYRFDRLTCSLLALTDHAVIRDNSCDLWGDGECYENILAVISKDELPQ